MPQSDIIKAMKGKDFMTISEIAEKVGTTRTSVQKCLKRIQKTFDVESRKAYDKKVSNGSCPYEYKLK